MRRSTSARLSIVQVATLLAIAACGSADRIGATSETTPADASAPTTKGATDGGADGSERADGDVLPSTDPQLQLAWVKTFTGPGHQGAAGLVAEGESLFTVTQIDDTTTFGAGEPGAISIDAEIVSMVHAHLDPSGSLVGALRTTRRPGGAVNGGTLPGPIAKLSGGDLLTGGGVVGTREFSPGTTNATVVAAPVSSVGGATSAPEWMTLARYDASGTLKWLRHATGRTSWPHDLAVTEDGASVMTGNFTEAITLGPGESRETSFTSPSAKVPAFLARFDASGSLAWARQVAGDEVMLYAVTTNPSDGAIYVTGTFRGVATFGAGEPHETTLTSNTTGTDRTAIVARFTSQGAVEWVRVLGDGAVSNRIVRTLDGNVVVAGSFTGARTIAGTSLQSAPGSPGNRDVFVAKLDTQGALLWQRQLGGDGDDEVGPLRVDADGALWLLPMSQDGSSMHVQSGGTLPMSASDMVTWLIAFAPDGLVRRFERVGTGIQASDLAFHPSGAVSIAGQAFGPNSAKVGGKTFSIDGVTDTFVAHFTR